MAERKFFILGKVAEIFKQSMRWALTWADAGDLPTHKDNLGVHCTREDIEQFVEDYPNLKDYWIRYTRNEIWELPDPEQTEFKISDFNTDWVDQIREIEQNRKKKSIFRRKEITITFTVKEETVPGLFHDPEDFVTHAFSQIKYTLQAYEPEFVASAIKDVE